jgi:hypothetical protein
MGSEKDILFVIWRVGFHAGCIGLIVMGSLAVPVVLLTAFMEISSGSSIPLVLTAALCGLLLGAAFVTIGMKGLRVRTRAGLSAEMAAFDARRKQLEDRINRVKVD